MSRAVLVATVTLVTVTLAAALAIGAGTDDPKRIAPFRAEVPALPIPVPADAREDASEEVVADAEPEPSGPAQEQPGRPASGAPSDAEVAAELREAFTLPEGEKASGRDIVDSATLGPDGLASAPPSAPKAVRAIIHAGNQVARKPYVYGGGHGRLADSVFVDTAYDCSGSISYAFAAAGLVDRPMVSGELARFGEPGPGKWVTIYANDGHVFMTVGGLRFDTSGRQKTGSRWQAATRSTAGFTVRHPKGL